MGRKEDIGRQAAGALDSTRRGIQPARDAIGRAAVTVIWEVGRKTLRYEIEDLKDHFSDARERLLT